MALMKRAGFVLLILLAPIANAEVGAETAFTFNTFSFLVWGCLVMWMCAGFTMLESGSVRTKNASVICLKNVGLYSIAGIMFFIIGYNLMYVGVDGGYIGTFSLFYGSSPEEVALLGGDASQETVAAVTGNGYSVMSDWFFQMCFVATTASIMSGALAERVRLWSFLLFVVFLTGVIYPVVGSWTWGGGWLSELGFLDFAGSTIVHSTGGWAALAGAIIVGARSGKFHEDGSVRPTPPSNIPIVTLGVFILWLGWFGFNGGSVLALGDAASATTMGVVLANTNLAACAGFVVALIISRPLFKRVDLLAALNGAIGGLVAITAGPDFVDHQWALLIGAIGGAVCLLGMKLLEYVKIDDVVGAIPAHLIAGIWGTIAVPITNPDASFLTQLVGIAVIGVFVFVVSLIIWWVLKITIGARVTQDVEDLGQDAAELGLEAYPEFVLMPDESMSESLSSDR